ncbi:unnamed protein product [Prorocentrum cordatum]|uniref:BTB domain-containing protein n=1 Tax=Prorocentrum cordatum TaxID=2364126 RepID=A0ABN9UU24_9DINO|nr:unnamed protein product [Polarella glacialis]
MEDATEVQVGSDAACTGHSRAEKQAWTQLLRPRTPARVDVPFPELPSDADTEIPSWRTGLHSDWRLRLGPTEYRIHKVLTGHGPRASAFLCSAFTTGQQLAAGGAACSGGSSGSSETDLSNILPEQVWPFFGEVLDYVYTEDLSLSDENAVPLLRCADALQIKSLFLAAQVGINELLSVSSAPRILADAAVLLGGALADQIQRASQDVVAEHFDAYPPEDLQRIPTCQLVQILKRDDLSVIHENEVFDRVLELVGHMEAHGRAAEVAQVWQAVRFGALSNSCVVRAAQVEAVPNMALIWAKVLHRKSATQSAPDGWPVGPARPRKPFKDMVCAVMYSVDTDARNDQDVERNITAATLVAEEIEFLGGRAILENIFARSPSSIAGPLGTTDSSIINIDQIDVAFVLAPWTPELKRISTLINFADQGGGVVLLSFIGGLSKGSWLEQQYEPLITGKVAGDTPYEDVYLATPASGVDDPMKRSQDTVTPPRILCGVDSINGRRRITSRLVDGAKVLAKWSDGQPLVVQHPKLNIFSVSQRVSRIFELDDELGHDDTLQLVLNVMVEAGKEARRVRGPKAPLVGSIGDLVNGTFSLGVTDGSREASLQGVAAGGVNVSL